MQSNTISRRNVLAGAGAAAGGLALACPAMANVTGSSSSEADAELEALWREYLAAGHACEFAQAKADRASDRTNFEAERLCYSERLQHDEWQQEGSDSRWWGIFYTMKNGEREHFGVPLGRDVVTANEASEACRDFVVTIRRSHYRHIRENRRYYRLRDLEREAHKRWRRMKRLERRMVSMEAHTAEGASIQLAVSQRYIGDSLDPDYDGARSGYGVLAKLTGRDYAAEYEAMERQAREAGAAEIDAIKGIRCGTPDRRAA